MRIVLGVAGGIAAYKAVLLLRLLREAGHDVRVVPTAAALQFVGAATWEALSGQPVTTDVFEDVDQVAHVAVGKQAELVVVAPATADLLARAATGRADDLLTATLLVARCPVLMAPAMHTEMWEHPATVANVETLRRRGVHVLDPASGRLTGADTGPGRLPEPEEIAAAAFALAGPRDLAGRHVVVSAGGTREPLDPVRFLGNRSSGRQGVALARVAAARGARVTLVAANLAVPPPAGVDVVPVETAAQLRDAVRAAAKDADVVVMAAAVADYRPASVQGAKIKKRADRSAPAIELVENVDVLAELAGERLREGQLVVGFAAETGDDDGSVLEHGRAKALRKGADLLVVNAVGEGRGFGTDVNEVVVLDGAGQVVATAGGTKDDVAGTVWDAVRDRW
ncbi:bifunctional phosphopantothenoylcysteine decarboxylase/phosphopantothenate--cysteine ligase CoaBC [Cellulomonas fimi]|uniref:Coenzyme A biosynthesis bifunctional protein CoaBC n=1 Tax=Cellulomonas fimi (strain ATCC 484 / DSM 20113 / JCM 1341 / CCUG 24087 / LMG 16345 / NBRC 15513 / NCIMB 8980 / NCTC 7547 / NRS-133) TaxID=590998 RepID=F4GZQ8_CELFA|nr:bifunctional phosphopantothenoylcysteine decarboxylase/phosphopantothenate--cysteine ligase CoaBC [Cellulomonas fimi]AEE46102.1 phosphopantothenoylcysteine decarboxylase/phosphopantothenate/cysteine ligase [Cellulomonas fimi ATCC 484]NNH09217.1 bifunctional phosphopantothenoylcysteine decarboxylase/phosphopantothenate--cysteine ligase CoaBC [Cellulomonas fimi]VEH31638.1 DNA/pantothenate metabolism flavoprotein [Cellulomonas fimi]